GSQRNAERAGEAIRRAASDLSSPVGADTDSTASSKDPEDIPTFDEWKRKMMEVEKEKIALSTHTSNNGGSHTVKKVQKNFHNYASVECGAKLLGANPEAKSTSAILKENMDLYMLNPCSTKIWFIIELCEPIQLKQLDIANFELFSSTPKDFLVSISDRYPTNKWSKLGTFHARDERTVQSFPLDEHLYAKYVKMFTKYIKVELLSHFGSEHFCPLSLISRVFGTSMVEEYEIADPPERPEDQDDDLDYPPGGVPGEDKSKNLIGSAKDAIFNMVKDIAVVLGGNQETTGNLSSQAAENATNVATLVPNSTECSRLSGCVSSPDAADMQGLTDSSAPDTSTPDNCEEKLPLVEEKIVIPLGKEEDESIASTIILLDKEEELEDDKKDHQEQDEENLEYCPARSSSCSCTTSFQEFLLQQCSASLSRKRTCQTVDIVETIPSIVTPPTPPSSSAQPEPRPHPGEADWSDEKDPDSELQPDRDAMDAEVAPPSENPEGSVSEHNDLEPKTPDVSSEEPKYESGPEKSQDVSTEEKLVEPSRSLSGSSAEVKPSVSADDDPTEEKPNVESAQEETRASNKTQDDLNQTSVSSSASSKNQVEPLESLPTSSEVPPKAADMTTEPEPALSPVTDAKMDDPAEEFPVPSGGQDQLFRPSVPTSTSPTSSSLLDIYAEPFNGTEQNGNQVHGSSQKESVFMRLNNRIKALEVNMSLSGRYLEQLSQSSRYRKQMEEMQRAFNKTIIKLQNTSRIAEEQDLRQTESIQLLQGQLENVTQLVLNLSVRVSQLQNEVSDRQSYLLLSLVLCVCLGILLCVNHFRITVPPTADPEPPSTKSPTYCSPERLYPPCDEMGLKRRASYPLINSESFQLPDAEVMSWQDYLISYVLHFSPRHTQRRRRKLKPPDRVETLKPCFQSAPELCNGAVGRSRGDVTAHAAPLIKHLLQPVFRDSPSEGSSEGSSQSDDPSFCGLTSACSRICDGLPPVKTRAEKRALRRRRLK
uniref:SUN domain-containing protein n=1 Tax=Poecilia formosa TaxID=48698 RepID=A0A087XZX1_POEFO